ncbi:MAG: bifunctional riboflavin kinase/FAD synthetase [Calditerrivibrio sp.]
MMGQFLLIKQLISFNNNDNLLFMIIIKGIENIDIDFETSITLGNFDGVHIGHKRIIEKTVNIAREYGIKSVVVTFDPHPIAFFGQRVDLLTNLEKKNQILETMGVDFHMVMSFNKELMMMDPEVFIREIIVKRLKAKYVVVGYDYKFGSRRKGDFELLKIFSSRYGYEAYRYDRVVVDNMTVSSSNIRKLLKEGNLSLANKMLDRYYSVLGQVVKGDGIGRLLSYPTANIVVADFLIPKYGVYATLIDIDGKIYPCVTNVGIRPTIPGKNELRIESFIFDFYDDIYNKNVELFFVQFIRDEMKFENFDDLKNRIAIDCEVAKNILDNLK